MIGLTGLLLFGIFNCTQLFFTKSLSDLTLKSNATGIILLLIGLCVPAFLLNYFVLFKGDNYLEYFKEFDEIDSSEKLKYYLISTFVALLIFSFFVYSFKFMR